MKACHLRGSALLSIFLLIGIPNRQAQADLSGDDLNSQILVFSEVVTSMIIGVPPTDPQAIVMAETIGGAFQNLMSTTPSTDDNDIQTSCNYCQAGVGFAMEQIRSGAPFALISTLTNGICTKFGVGSATICSGLIERMGPILYYIVNNPNITTSMVCGIVFESAGCNTTTDFANWSVALNPPANKFWPRKPIYSAEFPISKPIKFLQLTDIHYDPLYAPGSNAACSDPMCCHSGKNDNLLTRNVTAGQFGDYRNCDLPYKSLVNALEHISTTHTDIEVIVITGDMVPHDLWYTSQHSNKEIISAVSELIGHYFPEAQIVPVIGNHDVHPANQFSPHGVPRNLSTDCTYKWISKQWKEWIPRDARKSLANAGFYAIQLTPKFKIIVLNTNLCYNFNFWVIYDPQDPGNQLQWLVSELWEAKNHGSKVHIMGHLPPSLGDCWSAWSKNYYAIINQFSDIVTAQLFAHTHFDEFQVYYDQTNHMTPISAIWVGPSLTPYTELNPGYKIYSVDSRSLEVTDYETWIYDLTQANIDFPAQPHWFQLYQATKVFGIPDVTLANLDTMIKSLANEGDPTMFNKYYTYYNKGHGNPADCDNNCRINLICRIVIPYYGEKDECHRLTAGLQNNSN